MTLTELHQRLKATPFGKSAPLRDLTPAARPDWPVLAPNRPAEPAIAAVISGVSGESVRQTTLLRAGLYLMHDFLDPSHIQSQSMEGDPDADLWHAIMHRREPDYGNSKYWYRHVGDHPVFGELASLAAPLLTTAGVPGFSSDRWDPYRFVDLCQQAEREQSPQNLAARQVQWIEMSLHLSYCLQGR